MATEAIIEEVAQNLEEVAEVTRKINSAGVGYFLGGIGIGVAIGFFFGYRFNREKIRAAAFLESEEEVQKIREVYRQRTIAIESVEAKKPLEEIIADRGYATKVTNEEMEQARQERPLPAPVPIIEAPAAAHDPGPDWIYAKELSQRSDKHPYVIHEDEFTANETEYAQVAYTYFEVDDVLVDDDDKPLPHGDLVVGQDNLKWGHGSRDPNIVFVRNDKLEIDMEITRSPKSYEQEVLGMELEHSDSFDSRRRRRSRFDEDVDN